MPFSFIVPVVLLFLVVILLVTLVIVVVSAKHREYVHYFFILFMIASAIWAGGIGLFLWSATPQVAALSARIYYIAAVIIVYSLVLLVMAIPVQRSNSSTIRDIQHLWRWLLAPIVGVVVLILMPGGVINTIVMGTTDVWNSVRLEGFGYGVYTAVFLLYAASATGLLFYKFQHARERRYRRQLKYIAGSALFGVGFGSFFNLFLPLFGNYDLIWVGPLCGIPVVATVFYSIIRHSLFDIRLAVVRTVTYTLSLATLATGYYLLVLAVSTVLVRESSSVEQNITSAAIVIILAFIFQPVRHFFDTVTSRVFYKNSYSTAVFFSHLTRILAVNSDLRNLLERATQEIVETMKAKQGFFFVYYGDNLYMTAGTLHHSKVPLADIMVLEEYAQSKGGDIIVTELLEQQHTVHRLLVSHRVALVLPLFRGKEVVGYFCLGEHQAGNYTSRDLRTLAMTADELIIAIQNALSVQELRELNATLQQRINGATKELRASNAQLRRLDAAKDEFVSMASHQLRTPLTSVKGYISMVLEGDAGKISDMQTHLLSEAFTSSERMVHLINDFLNVSRLQTGKFMIDKRPVDLAHIVRQELDGLQTSAASRGLKFAYRQPKNFPILDLDESKIRQVIMNFADNALYYSPEKSTITVRLALEGSDVVFTVKDTGIGVPKEEQAELFGKFYRASNARKQRPDGTGVGLFLAKKVIDAHDGVVVFESAEGKGSTFGFKLPLAKLRAVRDADYLSNEQNNK